MKVIAIASMVAAAAASSQPTQMQMFEEFIAKYNKQYLSEAEKARRFKVFKTNLAIIDASNKRGNSYTLGITVHADITPAEFRAQFTGGFQKSAELSAERKQTAFTAPEGFKAPESVDWVQKGAVTDVKNQGTCGSCWAFSAAGSLEGAMFVAGRPLVSLSEQQIIACDKSGNGCQGGSMDLAFEYVSKSGLESYKEDPYLCLDGSSSECQSMQCDAWGKKTLAPGDVLKHTDVAPTEDALEAAVAQQPVSVAIEADSSVFQHYTGGVLTSDGCGSKLDHGVLVVGYGELDGQKYWRVKNSWSSQWGDNGYINIARGSTSDGGECGIRKAATFPTVGASQIVV